jgi:hypothetical protein
MAFDILPALAGIPAKPHIFHNYIILLIALSVKSIEKIIEKIQHKPKIQNTRGSTITKIPQFDTKNYELLTMNCQLLHFSR